MPAYDALIDKCQCCLQMKKKVMDPIAVAEREAGLCPLKPGEEVTFCEEDGEDLHPIQQL